ncbi:MAG TPA: glycoside hydrolase family 172 protein [Isosphaeraceae bacterium]|nr:glycoside hydrolase family 172 protein [Isosphaeraceae bacterium]
MRTSICALTCGLVLAITAPLRAADQTVTVESLLERMIDLRWLAQTPSPGELEFQFSSYDRKSRLVADTIADPFANNDRGHYLRVEGSGDAREWVLADADGPGYVSRIWSANPDGELRIYIDGSPRPSLAAPFAELTNGEIPPFTAPYGHDASRGRNLYFPFPFAKHIKITTTKGDQYYQVNVTRLPADTQVESYSEAVLKRASAQVESIRRRLLDPEILSPKTAAESRVSFEIKLDPGGRQELNTLQPGAITSLRWAIEAADRDDALAHVLLTITFDAPDGSSETAEPQVAVPLGDFFGSGPGLNPFRTAVSSVSKDGKLTSRWYMPFAKSARIRLTNLSKQVVTIKGQNTVDATPPPQSVMHFHARWRYEDGIATKQGDGTRDWRALEVHGKPGRFVGLLLNVFNPTTAWWGEGDEKVYVDGERFPSTFGTGTEDYFGFAWCDPHGYAQPFHAQTRSDGPANRGNASEVRYQILDAIPWQSSFAFDMEIWHWEAVKVQYATMAYFYAAPGAAISPGVPDLSQRLIHQSPPVHREKDVVEGEDLKVDPKTAEVVVIQGMVGFGEVWSGGSQLWWICHKKGASIALDLPETKGGTFEVSAAFTKAGDYGIAALSLDGQPVGEPLDLYAPSPQVVHTGEIKLGKVALKPGPHVLNVTMTDKNPKSSNYLFGLDWIKFVPARSAAAQSH